jgi:hypothetical protein
MSSRYFAVKLELLQGSLLADDVVAMLERELGERAEGVVVVSVGTGTYDRLVDLARATARTDG